MSKPKIKLYRYSNDGRYIEKFESITEARNKFYANYVGKIPMFRKDSNFHFLPDGTVLTKNRIGREEVKKRVLIENNPLLNINNTKHTGRPIVVFDLNGDFIAEFKDIKTASILMNINTSKIVNLIKRHKGKYRRHNKLGIDIKFKK